MNKALLLTVALLCFASLAFAQPPGSVAVYADNGYGYMNPYSCEVLDGGVAAFYYITIHFVHVADDAGATAVEFQADMSQMSIGIDYGDVCPFPLKIGAFRDGASISYQTCLTETPGGIYLGSTTFRKSTQAYKHLCKYVYVKNHPIPGIAGSTTPLAVDCGDPADWLVLRGSYLVVSYDFTDCPCPGTIPTEESSWGQIKALYE